MLSSQIVMINAGISTEARRQLWSKERSERVQCVLISIIISRTKFVFEASSRVAETLPWSPVMEKLRPRGRNTIQYLPPMPCQARLAEAMRTAHLSGCTDHQIKRTRRYGSRQVHESQSKTAANKKRIEAAADIITMSYDLLHP